MRRTCTIFCLALLAAGSICGASVQGEEPSWTGKDIVMKRNGVTIGRTDENGNPVNLAKLTSISYKVLADRDGWLKVKQGKNQGWFDKEEAVLLEDPDFARKNGAQARARLRLYREKKPYTVVQDTPKTPAAPPPEPRETPRPADPSAVTSGPLKGWKQFKAPDGSFTIAFPQRPRSHKQRIASGVGNIDNYAYAHEGADLTYLASYFDFPADGVLTLDTAAAAFALGSKGKLSSKKPIRLGDNPGLEIVVQLPDENIQRARLYEVGQRRFQIVISGPKELVNSEQATHFLDSFKLSRE